MKTLKTLWFSFKMAALLALSLGLHAAPCPPDDYVLYFDGVDDRVTIPHNAAYNIGTNGNFTIEAWVKIPTSSPDRPILSQRTSSTDGFLFLPYYGGTQLLLQINGVYGGNLLSSSFPTIYDGNPHHVAVTRSGSSITFYVDGVAKGTATKSNTLASTGNLYIGYDAVDNNSFTGSINEVRFWNITRSASDISYYKSIGLPLPSTGLIGYWKFDECSTQTVYDNSSIMNNAGYLGSDNSETTKDPARRTISNAREDIGSSSDESDNSVGQNGFNFFPNPAKAGQQLSFQNAGEGTQTLRILDQKGSLIVEQQILLVNGKGTLSLQGVEPGIYFLQGGFSGIVKLIVQ